MTPEKIEELRQRILSGDVYFEGREEAFGELCTLAMQSLLPEAGFAELYEAARLAEVALRNGGTFPINGRTWQRLHDAIQRLGPASELNFGLQCEPQKSSAK